MKELIFLKLQLYWIDMIKRAEWGKFLYLTGAHFYQKNDRPFLIFHNASLMSVVLHLEKKPPFSLEIFTLNVPWNVFVIGLSEMRDGNMDCNPLSRVTNDHSGTSESRLIQDLDHYDVAWHVYVVMETGIGMECSWKYCVLRIPHGFCYTMP